MMRVTTLGGRAAWPGPDHGCSGYLVQTGSSMLLLDPGYGTLGPLLATLPAATVDAVWVSHAHPDHCGDLAALLRARVLPAPGNRPAPLPIHSPAGSVDAVIALDEPETLEDSYELRPVGAGEVFSLADAEACTVALPHFVPNLAVRLDAGGRSLVYTGDGPITPELVDLAGGVDLLVADATYVDGVPERHAGRLGTARAAGEAAAAAGVGRLLLTHLWPDTDPDRARAVARSAYSGPVDVAVPHLVLDL